MMTGVCLFYPNNDHNICCTKRYYNTLKELSSLWPWHSSECGVNAYRLITQGHFRLGWRHRGLGFGTSLGDENNQKVCQNIVRAGLPSVAAADLVL